MSYIQLFLSFLQIGAFSFGGGYAAMPLIQNQVVTLHHWLTAGEFNDLVTISQIDARADCRQFRNLCRAAHCRTSGSGCSHCRLYSAILYSGVDSGIRLYEI